MVVILRGSYAQFLLTSTSLVVSLNPFSCILVLEFGVGGFEFGGIAKHNGIPIVMRSVEMGKPIIYVAMNYR